MTANTSILVARVEHALRVPNSALRYTPSEMLQSEADKRALTERKFAKKSSSHIWILDSGELKQVAVKMGIGDDTFTEILEGEVKEGQEAVTGEITPTSAAKTSQKVPWGRSRY